MRQTAHVKTSLAWLVLAGVFAAELAALAALYVWGRDVGGGWLGVALTAAAAVAWGLFAAPKARYQVPAAALLVKVTVFAAAVLGLCWTGHLTSAVVLGGFVALVHALAALPAVRAAAAEV